MNFLPMLAFFPPHHFHFTTPPFTYIAIDIHTVSFDLKTPSLAPLTPAKATTHICKAHNEGAHQKFCHKPILTFLNSSTILFLPFTINLYGSLGG
jgi:hypothetical protein